MLIQSEIVRDMAVHNVGRHQGTTKNHTPFPDSTLSKKELVQDRKTARNKANRHRRRGSLGTSVTTVPVLPGSLLRLNGAGIFSRGARPRHPSGILGPH